MSKFSITATTLFAMLIAASAMATCAFAEEALWLENGNEIKASTNAIIESLVLVTNLTILGNFEMDCKGQWMGQVGPGSAGKITSILSEGPEIGSNLTGNALNCEVENEGLCKLKELASVWTDNLPWNSVIGLMVKAAPGEFLDAFTAGGSGKEPGFELQCNGLTQLCEGKVSAGLENNAASKDVNFFFNEAAPIETEKSEKCETGSGDIFGEGLVFLENGQTLTVSSP